MEGVWSQEEASGVNYCLSCVSGVVLMEVSSPSRGAELDTCFKFGSSFKKDSLLLLSPLLQTPAASSSFSP